MSTNQNGTYPPRPEDFVNGPGRAPGTVQIRRPIVLAGAAVVMIFFFVMLYFTFGRIAAIAGQGQPVAAKPGVVANPAPANVSDLGMSTHSDALPDPRPPVERPVPVPTLSSSDLTGTAPVPQPPIVPAAENPSSYSVPPPPPPSAPRPPAPPSAAQLARQAMLDRRARAAAEDRAAAEADLHARFDDGVAAGPNASGGRAAAAPAVRAAARFTEPEDYDVAPVSEYVLQRGMVIPATLYTSIDSTIPGTVVAFSNQDVYDAQHRAIVIPRGSRITGSYASTTVQGQRRLAVAWDAIKLPNGHTLVLDGMPGVDLTGTTGFGAAGDNHTRKMFGSVVLLSILAAGAQLAQPQQNASCGVTAGNCPPSFGQSVASSVGSELAQAGATILQRDANIPPTLHVVEGAQVAIMVQHDLPMHPWTAR